MLEEDFQATDLIFTRPTWEKIRKPVISIFVAINLSCFFLYLLMPNTVIGAVLDPFQKYFAFLALTQAYGVFSPNPAAINAYILALVTYDDGTQQIYQCPRLERVGLINKLRDERFRKFYEDNVTNPNIPYLARDAARYIARQCNSLQNRQGNNAPRSVTVYMMSSEIPPIHKHAANVPQSNIKVLCTYEVKKEDLNETVDAR